MSATRLPPDTPASADEVSVARRRRAQNMLLSGGGLLAFIGLGWALFFALMGNWPVAVIELLLLLLGVAVMALAWKQKFRMAAWLLFASLFVTLIAFSLWLDVPTPQAPRSSHIFFLSLGVSAYYVFQGEKPWVRHATVAAYLGAFLFFASTHVAIYTPYAIPDTVRLTGTWVNAAFALLVLYMSLYLMDQDITRRSGLHVAMRDGLAARRFELFYQPQVDAAGRVVGAEALLRWQDPVRGLVSPAVFVPLAEQTGFILPLGQWALDTACAQLARWKHRPQTSHLTLSVNVSAHQVRQPDFVSQVLQAIGRTHAPPERLKLELTESMLVHDIDDLIQKMQALRAHGVGFSLDDFGTGYSSLSYLKRLPLHQLKIDQSFVRDVATDPNAAAITRTLISLGQSLGLTVIAEGVETRQQCEFLMNQGCLVFQGYLFSRPLDSGAFEHFLNERRPVGIRAANEPAKILTSLEAASD